MRFDPVLSFFIMLFGWILSRALNPLDPPLILFSLSCALLTASCQGLKISWEVPPEEFGAD